MPSMPGPRRLGGTNVAASLDRFVGREGELGRLEETFAADQRLVTVVGPGGMGKTRLVREFCRRALERFEGGLWFCDLSDATDLDGLVGGVAQLLGVDLGAGPDSEQRVGRVLSARPPTLLVLDSLEQIEDAAAVLRGWLEAGSTVSILVTSRHPMDVPGEVIQRLDSLPVADAIELFSERASRLWSGWDGTRERGDVELLVQALDGLPLAIEMAAAHIQVLRPGEMLSRLETRSQELVGGPEQTGRHRTLRTTMNWSWDLLQEWEREALVQLSVFRGGFTLDAADEVLQLQDAPATEHVVRSLLRRSLLRLRVVDGLRRFGLYVSVRDYAGEHLEGDRGRAVRRRHASCFAMLRDEPVPRIAEDIDNMLEAARWAIAVGERDLAGTTCAAALRVLTQRGPLLPAVNLARAALDGALRPDARAEIRMQAAQALQAIGRSSQGAAICREALEEAQAAGDVGAECDATHFLALSLFADDHASTTRYYGRALELAEQLGDVRRIAREHNGLGIALSRVFHLEEARHHLQEGARAARECGDLDIEAKALSVLGVVCRKQGRWQAAADLYEQAIGHARALGYRRREGIILSNLGALELDRGRVHLGRATLQEALLIHEEIGEVRSQVIALSNLTLGALVLGELEEAHRTVRRMMDGLGQLENSMLTRSLERIRAVVLRARGQPREAEEIWTRVLQFALETENRHLEAEARSALGGLWGELGRLDAAVEEARRGVAAARPLEVPRRLADSLRELGGVLFARGELDEAAAAYDVAVAVLARAGHDVDLASALASAGRVAALQGRLDAARAAAQRVQTIVEKVGFGPQSAARAELAGLIEALGDARPTPALKIGPDLAWVEPPGGERIPMGRKAVLRRVFARLLQERVASPGHEVGPQELVETAWPDDRSDADALTNRLYVAIHGLRKLGLDGVLLSRGDGYMLDPTVPIEGIAQAPGSGGGP